MSLAKSTPTSNATASQTTTAEESPGTWRHPRLDEINKRLSRNSFGERNIRTVIWSAALVFSTVLLRQAFFSFSTTAAIANSIGYILNEGLYILWICLTVNVLIACLPLLRAKDDLSDIPLTPRQRALLGLQPSSARVTPGSSYLTPPKYTPSSTPRSSDTGRSSPFSGSSRGTGATRAPYSPSASPLFQKAVSRDVTRRLSYGTPSPLSLNKIGGESSGSLISQHTPSPSAGRGPSIGLNSRWLYEKDRSSSSLRGFS